MFFILLLFIQFELEMFPIIQAKPKLLPTERMHARLHPTTVLQVPFFLTSNPLNKKSPGIPGLFAI
jgi:hypothetical protein